MKKRRSNHFIRNWNILFTLLALVYFGIKGYWNSLLSPPSSDAVPQSFTVSEGEGSSAIADALDKQNLIRSANAFKLELKLSGDVGKLEAGTFNISPSESTPQIIRQMEKSSSDISVTLLEGLRDEEMAAQLNKRLGISTEAFLRVAKQGYMFPDTYNFDSKATADSIAQTMENNFNAKYTADLQDKIKNLGLSPTQGIILASIVEREGRSQGVRTMVASILLKRLKIGMALDVDATIQYALGYSSDENSWWRKNISADDLKIDSPYNTYTHSGLPPTPICNPGLSSITAVTNADPSTPYLYYYQDSEGNSYYERTLDQHNTDAANHP